MNTDFGFNFFYGGYGSDKSYQLKLNGNALNIFEYQGIPNPENGKVILINDNRNWEHLIDFLRNCEWKKEYYNDDMFDGMQWELDFRFKDSHRKCSGSNAYPENFNDFLLLLNRVISEVGMKIVK